MCGTVLGAAPTIQTKGRPPTTPYRSPILPYNRHCPDDRYVVFAAWERGPCRIFTFVYKSTTRSLFVSPPLVYFPPPLFAASPSPRLDTSHHPPSPSPEPLHHSSLSLSLARVRRCIVSLLYVRSAFTALTLTTPPAPQHDRILAHLGRLLNLSHRPSTGAR